MKRTIIALLMIGVLLLTGCGPAVNTDGANGSPPNLTEGSSVYYSSVEFYADGEVYHSAKVATGSCVGYVNPPVKEDHIFSGWYTDEACTQLYDFSTPVSLSIKLYAGYTVDAASLTNKITTGVIRSVVQVKVTHYEALLGFKYNKESYIGSGVIFSISEKDDRAYLLTNCHVAQVKSGKDGADYTIVDYLGGEYTGHLYKNVNGENAISAEYDLACLWFEDPSDKLQAIAYAEASATVGEQVVSLGYPQGQSNAITFGKVTGNPTITLTDCAAYLSCVTFPVTGHTAVINGGSSGGPLLNTALQLVGINYAGDDNDEDFHKGYAIPLDKVWEFLESYVYVGKSGAAKPVN